MHYSPHDLSVLAHLDFCYLTTSGRVSGKPHTIEIWFALHNHTVYLLAGNHASDWVKNARRTPTVSLAIGDATFTGTARIVDQEAELRPADANRDRQDAIASFLNHVQESSA